MELLVQFILVIALLKYALKASLAGGFRTHLIYAVGAGLWAMVCYPLVISVPVVIVEQLLTNRQFVADAAVLTTIEAVAGIMLAVKLFDNYFVPKERRMKSLFVLKVIPGLLAPLAILYFELMFFKMRVAESFLATAVIYSVGCAVVILGLTLLIKYTVGGESLKLEMKLLLNMMILLMGLLINAAVADYNISAAHTETEWLPLLTLIAIFAVCIALGYFTRNLNFKKLFNIKRWTK